MNVSRLRPGAVICVLIALGGSAMAAPFATISGVVLQVTYRAPGSANWAAARVGTKLFAGAQVRTGKRSKCEVRFPDGSRVRLNELSDLAITDAGSKNLKLNRGNLYARVIAGTGARIAGAGGVASINGTVLTYDGDTLAVYEGEATNELPRGPVQVPAGNAAGSKFPNVYAVPDEKWEGGQFRPWFDDVRSGVEYGTNLGTPAGDRLKAERVGVQTAAGAFSELDSGERSFALAEPALRRTESGTWRAVELGAAVRTSPSVPPPPPAAVPAPAKASVPPPAMPSPEPPLTSLAPDAARGALRSPRAFEATMRDATLTCPEGEPVAMHASGLVLVQTTPEFEFAARLDALRSYTGDLTTQVLQRQTRTASQEPFGGVAAPLMRLRAGGPLVLGPRASHRLVPLRLDGELAFLREDAVLGFDLRLTFENGRLTFAEAEQLYVVQFRGAGTVVLELLDPIVVLPVTPQRAVTARRESIIGWQGRLLPRALPMSEAPSGQRGLVTFAGDGALLLSGH